MDKVVRLTAEQEAVRNLGVDGRYIVTGPPGTGKSLLAVLRAAKIIAGNQQILVLSKNVPLNSHLKDTVAPALEGIQSTSNLLGDPESFIKTYDSFSYGLWWKVGKAAGKTYPDRRGPMLDSDPDWHYDWETALRDIQARIDPDEARELLSIPKNIIVDEGQDLPQGFFKFMTMMRTNLTVFADENQRIGKQKSCISEIKLAMGISKSGGHEYQVRKNFRNTRQTAEIAAKFYTGLETGIPDLPEKVGPKPAVVGFSGIDGLASAVLQLARRKGGTARGTGPSVGVVVLDHNQDYKGTERRIRKLKQELERQAEQDDEVVNTRWYQKSKGFREDPFVFDEPESVCIIKSSTMKGMEWDNVLVWLGDYQSEEDPERLIDEKMSLYVAASRPRNRLVIAWTNSDLQNGGPAPEVLSGLLEPELRDKVERGWKNG